MDSVIESISQLDLAMGGNGKTGPMTTEAIAYIKSLISKNIGIQ